MDPNNIRFTGPTTPNLMTTQEEVDMDAPALSYEGFTHGSVSARQFSVNIHNINNVNFNYGGHSPDIFQENAPENLPYNDPFAQRHTFDTNLPRPEERDSNGFIRDPQTGEWIRRGLEGQQRHDDHSHNPEGGKIPQEHMFPDTFRHHPRPYPSPQPHVNPDHSRNPEGGRIPQEFMFPDVFRHHPPPFPLPRPRPRPSVDPVHTPTEVPDEIRDDEIPAWAAASRNTIFSRNPHTLPPQPVNPAGPPKETPQPAYRGLFKAIPGPGRDTGHRTGDSPNRTS
ncbi:hypothetical protein F4813DRAFT_384759 [Daldinia decipiens]|uniref:uncharacterized protein n=1 Tax=Daldinia decipiens TaxID=326647 RepID=UPI0020C5886B|nr:uncharacterized protein F4813DRAFT_384759 [Daldinia decipiens]KAI1662043.1 hypothetical protein F4813DRAFT_384759 [Daldinia decipiens]